jgi:hypothetical protein
MQLFIRTVAIGVTLGGGGLFAALAFLDGNPGGSAIFVGLTLITCLAMLLLIEKPTHRSRGFEPQRKPRG